MDIHNCSRCGPQPVSAFGWKNKAKGKLQAFCRSCQNANTKRWYRENSKHHIANVHRKRKINFQENTRLIYEYLLTHPCVDCGEPDPIVLDFDHVLGVKHRAVCVLLRGAHKWETILKEIAKCVVRCANCHRRKTAKQFNYLRYKLWCARSESNALPSD
jgi:ArsR family metal-binding transcriptional regulator